MLVQGSVLRQCQIAASIRETKDVACEIVTFSLSLMEPLPRIDIFVRVSSCRRFNEFPRGPRSLPTKLNCRKRDREQILARFCLVKHKEYTCEEEMLIRGNCCCEMFKRDRATIHKIWPRVGPANLMQSMFRSSEAQTFTLLINLNWKWARKEATGEQDDKKS